MLRLLREKFTDHPGLRGKLLATGDAYLEERNYWHDVIWGACTCSTHKGGGQNMLGVLLMIVRGELRSLVGIVGSPAGDLYRPDPGEEPF
jgi:predicted NAD-dependent protein-ADP-ribosyltransferase YbiA (DUF1768 family)